MLDITTASTKSYAIFSVSQARWQKVSRFISNMPHKWILGTWKGEIELSCVMPLDVFRHHEAFLMLDQQSWLLLDPVSTFDGSRDASFISRNGYVKMKRAGKFEEIASPKPDEDYSFDPATGTYYGIRN